jgi:cytidine deaminase
MTFPRPADGRAGHHAETGNGTGRRRAGFRTAALAAACARADLSHFNVGAIARGVSGTWYFGGNMEFLGATMQQTVHAEQSAISHAWLRGEKA